MTNLRLIGRVASSKDVIKINKKCFVYTETYYMLRFVQIRNNRYENGLIIFFTVGEYEYCISINKSLYYVRDVT